MRIEYFLIKNILASSSDAGIILITKSNYYETFILNHSHVRFDPKPENENFLRESVKGAKSFGSKIASDPIDALTGIPSSINLAEVATASSRMRDAQNNPANYEASLLASTGSDPAQAPQ